MGAPVKHTCPDIDRAIKHLKDALREIKGLEVEKRELNSIEWEIDRAIGYFEDMRQANQLLREWAEGLEGELESAASEISRLEDLCTAS